ncbi:hypothetical protein Tco_0509865, partial [Tanacetum coccineum]
QSGNLKKLDKIMGNEDFISNFPNAHAVFLPYLISDHCPTVLAIPNVVHKRKKAFRFANFTTDNEDFLFVVEKN